MTHDASDHSRRSRMRRVGRAARIVSGRRRARHGSEVCAARAGALPEHCQRLRPELHRAGAAGQSHPGDARDDCRALVHDWHDDCIHVDDKYGYDIDERVTLKVTYAVGRTRPFSSSTGTRVMRKVSAATNPVDVSASGTGFSDAVIQRISAAFGSGLGWHRHRARNEGWPGGVRPRGRPLVRDPVSARAWHHPPRGSGSGPRRTRARPRRPLRRDRPAAAAVERTWSSSTASPTTSGACGGRRGLWPSEGRQAFYVNGDVSGAGTRRR